MKPHAPMVAVLVACSVLAGLAVTARGGPDAPATWVASQDPSAPVPTGDEARHFRVLAVVQASGMGGVLDLPVQLVLPIASVLAGEAAGGVPYPARQTGGGLVELLGFALDVDSFLVREVDAAGERLGQEYLPVLVTPGSVQNTDPFHPERNPTVTLRWVMPGETNGPRMFHIYFQSLQNGDASPPKLSEDLVTALASSVGPGRGTRLFVPLYDLHGFGAQGAAEPRRVRVTALHDETDVLLYEYKGGLPLSTPAAELGNMSRGETREYILGNNGNNPSSGTVLVKATLPVLAEGISTRTGATTNAFLPSADGGYIGQTFLASPPEDQQLHVFCPTGKAQVLDPATGVRGCRVSISGGAGQDIGANGHRTVQAQAGQVTELNATLGQVVVQRYGEGMTYWPPVDGPVSASRFLGYAGATDRLLATSANEGACLLVVSETGVLADTGTNRLCPWEGTTGVFTDSRTWGTTFSRTWEVSGKSHAAGGVRIEEHTGRGGIGVASGLIDPTRFGTLVVPQSHDGGLHYRLYVPETNGAVLGSIVLFALHDGTSGTATSLGGEAMTIPPLREGQRFEIQGRSGWWTIEANRPVVAAWLRNGQGSFGGFAPGTTDAADVEVIAAEYVGHALDVEVVGSAFQQRQPGDLVEFRLNVTNRARATTGGGLPDAAVVSVSTPAGWNEVDVIPSRRDLAPGQSGLFDVRATVPNDVDPGSGGATLLAQVRSDENPTLQVVQPLQVSYIIRRGVEVIETSEGDSDVQRVIAEGDFASYTVRVRNLGSSPDSFDVRFSTPSERWTQDVTHAYVGDASRTPVLDGGEFVEYLVTVQPTEDAGAAAKLTTRVTASSVADRSKVDSARLVTVVGVDRSFKVDVDEPTRTIPPGQQTTFTMRIRNDVDVNEELGVEVLPSLPEGWSAPSIRWVEQNAPLEAVNHTIRMDPRETATLAITLEVSSDALPFDLGLLRLRLASRFDPDAPPSDTALRVLAKPVFGFTHHVVSPDHRIDPGTAVPVTIRLDATGNADQEVQVTPVLPTSAWSAVDASGATPPWNMSLPAFGNATLALTLHIPSDTPPGLAGSRAAFSLAAVNGTRMLNVSLDISPLRAAQADNGSVRLDPGRTNDIRVPVRNTGNLDVRVDGSWEGLDDWSVDVEGPILLEPGEEGILRTRIDVPADVEAGFSVQPTLRLTAGDETLDNASWDLVIGGPALSATSAGPPRPIDDTRSVYRVEVSNTGDQTAHNVSVLLLTPDGAVADRFQFQRILAGDTSTASLVGPPATGGMAVRVLADHAPDGFLLQLDHGDGEGFWNRATPAPSPLAMLAAAGAFTAWRRWRS